MTTAAELCKRCHQRKGDPSHRGMCTLCVNYLWDTESPRALKGGERVKDKRGIKRWVSYF